MQLLDRRMDADDQLGRVGRMASQGRPPPWQGRGRRRGRCRNRSSRSSQSSSAPHTWRRGHYSPRALCLWQSCLVSWCCLLSFDSGCMSIRQSWWPLENSCIFLRGRGLPIRGRFSSAMFAWKSGHVTSPSFLATRCFWCLGRPRSTGTMGDDFGKMLVRLWIHVCVSIWS